MAWLGQELPKDQQKDATPFAPRCTKDRIEERSSSIDATSSASCNWSSSTPPASTSRAKGREPGAAGLQQGPPARPAADDRRGRAGRAGPADLLQLWPGNTTDVTTLIPWPIASEPASGSAGSASWPIGHDQQGDDRGVGAGPPGVAVHPGGPDAAQSEVRDEVLSRAGRYRVVHPKCDESDALHPWMSRRSTSRAGGTSSVATRTRPARTRPIERRSWLRCGSSCGRGTSR